jgi:hypothetical protein
MNKDHHTKYTNINRDLDNNYTYEIKNMEILNRGITTISLLTWLIIIKYVILKDKTVQKLPKWMVYSLLSIPFAMSFFDLYNYYNFKTILSFPPTFGYCFSKKETNMSIGTLNMDCNNYQTNVVKSISSLLITRFYYINYVILLISLIVEPLSSIVKNGFIKYKSSQNIFKNREILLKILSITSMFSLIGYLSPVFSNSGIFSIIIYRFIVVFLNINISLLLLILIILNFNI